MSYVGTVYLTGLYDPRVSFLATHIGAFLTAQ